MTVHIKRPLAPAQPQDALTSSVETADWELDVTIVEGGPAADQLIRLTNDGCNSTCATACVSCP
ncbi:FxLD family lanthipeptide [Streptomyces phytophilus]|uniref:FxLD family lanthipeptide n=1 Tax=Streptomyces phytophilus TaxID=722715 RepID=UPI0015F12261|nr:FxLD family lanthipeptide [Streptomyces phytophilus]